MNIFDLNPKLDFIPLLKENGGWNVTFVHDRLKYLLNRKIHHNLYHLQIYLVSRIYIGTLSIYYGTFE